MFETMIHVPSRFRRASTTPIFDIPPSPDNYRTIDFNFSLQSSILTHDTLDSSTDESDSDILGLLLSPSQKISLVSDSIISDRIPVYHDEECLSWDPVPAVLDLLNILADNADVQMCVSICQVLKQRLAFTENLLAQWAESYILMLQRFQQWGLAAELISQSSIPSICKMNNVLYINAGVYHGAQRMSALPFAAGDVGDSSI